MGIMVHAGIEREIAAGGKTPRLGGVRGLPHADVEGARYDRHDLGAGLAVRRNLVTCRHLEAGQARAFLSGIAVKPRSLCSRRPGRQIGRASWRERVVKYGEI